MTEAIAERLYLMALEMVEEQLTRHSYYDKNVGEANMTTTYKVLNMGAQSGIKFEAEVAAGSRQFKVDFLLDTRFLHEFVPGVWTLVGAPQPSFNAATLN
ncbi:MAG: hypothetical protein ABIO72_00115 [Patescibacteria group bacterium]